MSTKTEQQTKTAVGSTRLVDTNMNMLEEHARELSGMGQDWKMYQWQCLPLGSMETQVYRVAGAVAPTKKTGPRKGETNWSKMDKATHREFYIKPDDHTQWMAEWEKKTDKCAECAGSGKTLRRWTQEDGAEYRPCRQCAGTGVSTTEVTHSAKN